MRGRQPVNIDKCARVYLLVLAEHQKIGDGQLIQFPRNGRMEVQAVQLIAKDEGCFLLGVEKGLDAKMIAGAEELSLPAVPNGEGEVAQQMLDAILAPDVIGMQDQFHVGGR